MDREHMRTRVAREHEQRREGGRHRGVVVAIGDTDQPEERINDD